MTGHYRLNEQLYDLIEFEKFVGQIGMSLYGSPASSGETRKEKCNWVANILARGTTRNRSHECAMVSGFRKSGDISSHVSLRRVNCVMNAKETGY